MATKTRKQKRRQRGGKTVQIKSKNLSSKTHYYNPEPDSTMRELVRYYFDQEIPKNSNFYKRIEEPNPQINVFKNNRKLNLQNKWNLPHTFGNDMETYTIFGYARKWIAERNEKSTQHVLPFILQLVRVVGKVILYSSAATEVIPKNVCQQFDFQRTPKMPILHIDAGFFSPGHEPNQFYTILNFEMKPTIGTPEFVRHYVKPAGVPLTTRSATPTEYEQKYLEEVERQADGRFNLRDEISIYCVKFYMNNDSQKLITDYAAQYNIPVYIFCQSY